MKLDIWFDIDGTTANPGSRYTKLRPPTGKHSADRSDRAYQQWLDKVQKNLHKDKPVVALRTMMRMLHFIQKWFGGVEVRFFTSREEKYRSATLKWLRKHNFPEIPLHMRRKGDKRGYGVLKEELIKKHSKKSNVIVVDDDPKGDMLRVCSLNGWTLLKCQTSGWVP